MIKVLLQVATERNSLAEQPSLSDFQHWALAAGQELRIDSAEVGVRIVDLVEAETLNRRYRQQFRATDVLSFPAEFPIKLVPDYLGDIVLAEQLVVDEARKQGKSLLHHWAHLFVHGMLHLCGYHHNNIEEARRMELSEIRILTALRIADPYQEAAGPSPI